MPFPSASHIGQRPDTSPCAPTPLSQRFAPGGTRTCGLPYRCHRVSHPRPIIETKAFRPSNCTRTTTNHILSSDNVSWLRDHRQSWLPRLIKTCGTVGLKHPQRQHCINTNGVTGLPALSHSGENCAGVDDSPVKRPNIVTHKILRAPPAYPRKEIRPSQQGYAVKTMPRRTYLEALLGCLLQGFTSQPPVPGS